MGKKQEKEEKKLMVENGVIVLEELISSGNGKCNPIRSYSAKQLRQATNNFESPCYSNTPASWFKAVLDHRSVLVRIGRNYVEAEMACRDIAISSQMSSHGRVLKLLGCCLELPVPALVYEDAENGPLNRVGGLGSEDSGSSSSSLPWKIRLRIAKDIAHALAYLHTAFSRPIIHRNVKPVNVLLDKDFVPKLLDFSLSISIPEGETQVECHRIIGTYEFMAPEYARMGVVTEKADVYSFGVCLLVLLTGKVAHTFVIYSDELACHTSRVEKKTWDEIVDPKLMEEAREMNSEEELRFRSESQACLELALTCVREQRDDRPTMIDVAKELKRIQSSRPS